MENGEVWARFEHDPRRVENAHLRASDRDRDVVNDVLSEAVADGRLTLDELHERADRVAGSKSLGELPAVIRDLVPDVPSGLSRVERLTPATRRAEAERRYRKERRNALTGFVYPSLICVAIWALSGFGFFWPAFVIIAFVGRLGYLAANKDDRIEAIERNLEKRQAKAIEARERRQRTSGESS